MFVWATRTLSVFALRGLFYLGLFLAVVVLHIAVTSALRAEGWNPGAALAVSGGLVLATVLGGNYAAGELRRRRAISREVARLALGLPEGPCCVVWRAKDDAKTSAMPWDLATPLRAPYPPLARRLGVEGVAVVDFEIGADGAPKNIHCIDAWPSDVFFHAAAAALREARFTIKPGRKARFGRSFRMPFVFRIAGAARLKDKGRRALPHRPVVIAAMRAAERLRDNLRA